jgi:hypothetical protein
MMGSIREFRAALAVLLMLLACGCAGAGLPAPSMTSTCGNRCADMSCPRGTYCMLDGICTPHCEQEPLPRDR